MRLCDCGEPATIKTAGAWICAECDRKDRNRYRTGTNGYFHIYNPQDYDTGNYLIHRPTTKRRPGRPRLVRVERRTPVRKWEPLPADPVARREEKLRRQRELMRKKRAQVK